MARDYNGIWFHQRIVEQYGAHEFYVSAAKEDDPMDVLTDVPLAEKSKTARRQASEHSRTVAHPSVWDSLLASARDEP